MSLLPIWNTDPLDFNALYAGHCFALPPLRSSRQLVQLVLQHWSTQFDCPPEAVHTKYSNADILSKLSVLRTLIRQSHQIQQEQASVAREAGFSDTFLMDSLRLRVVTPEMPNIADAQPVFYAHRDTWYANPIDQINFWMPLHDVSSSCTFQIYPSCFQKPISNNSDQFDYRSFSKEVGWQASGPTQTHRYPKALEWPTGPCFTLEGTSASVWCFSGQHLHQTCLRPSQSRVSLDFRCCPILSTDVPLPLNVDNRSSGSTKGDFIFMGARNLVP